MPWKETCTIGPTHAVYVDYLSGGYTKKGLCSYGSGPTGDKWIDRYRIQTDSMISSRRPGCAFRQRMSSRMAHQSFGPEKVMDRNRSIRSWE